MIPVNKRLERSRERDRETEKITQNYIFLQKRDRAKQKGKKRKP